MMRKEAREIALDTLALTRLLEKRISELETRIGALELSNKPQAEGERATDAVAPVDRTNRILTSGKTEEEQPDYRELRADGQQKSYVVLTEEERAKGFVRPVRQVYTHVGPTGPEHPLRDLTPEERERYSKYSYVKFEAYPEDANTTTGRFWTQAQLDKVGKGCGVSTTMGLALAETYARDPKFYGATMCVGCNTHLPVDEFVWKGTDERVGS